MNPDDLNVKILGIVGTPIRNGNCQYYLEIITRNCKTLTDKERQHEITGCFL